uniref:Uncharacterized protein n=1 Tax=viral metagenome TaxID=1070528 RepID=A0A6C0CEH8_9ZZZZ
MEGIILLGLAGAGYLMNKNKEEEEQSRSIETNVRPRVTQGSNSSIYDINNYLDSKKYEQLLLDKNFDQTLNNQSNMVSDYNAKLKEIEPKSDIVMGIDGNPINKDNFLVNDQGIKVEPYYRGDGPSAVDLARSTGLDRHQGMSDYRYTHRDARHNGVNLNGAPQPFVNGNPFGLSDTGPAMEQNRYDSGMYRTSELPFEQERVAHIDRNSDVNRDVGDIYAQRNGIDNLRALSNPKLTFEGKVIAGKGVDERGVEGQVFKNLPNQDYEQNAGQWLVTTGSTTSAQIRPAQILPETNRQYLNRQEIGVPGSSVNMSEEKRPMFKKSDRQQLESDTIRNAIGTEVYADGDHRMDSYNVYANEREVTSERTHQSNLLSNVPDQTVQLQDGIKRTVKETTLDPANPDGFFSMEEKRPEERLKDLPKTTVNETVNYEHNGIVSGPDGPTDNDQYSRADLKVCNHFDYTGNARGSTLQETASDQFDRADLKVCNHFEYTGNAQGSTLQEMAQDQYYRADLNINKEVIAQGREPTRESAKISNGGDIMNVDIKKIESDYFTHHQTGVDRVYQVIPQDQPCELTRSKDTLDNDKLAYRIEGDLLDPFKHNPYTQSLHSFAY